MQKFLNLRVCGDEKFRSSRFPLKFILQIIMLYILWRCRKRSTFCLSPSLKAQSLIIFPPQCLLILLNANFCLLCFSSFSQLSLPKKLYIKEKVPCLWLENWDLSSHTYIWIFFLLSLCLSLAVLYTKQRSTAAAVASSSFSPLKKKWNLTPNYSSMYSFSTFAFIFSTAPLFLPLPLHDHPLYYKVCLTGPFWLNNIREGLSSGR